MSEQDSGETTDQQAGSTRDEQDPYPPDQQMGASAARDQEAVDEAIGDDDTA